MMLILNFGRNTYHIISFLCQSGKFWRNQEELCSSTRIESYSYQTSANFHGAIDVLQGVVNTKTSE